MKPDGVDRRDFFKRSAATAAALAVLPSLGLGQTGGQAKPLRVGFIGVGGRGTVLLRFALMIDGVEIPAICDIDESHLGRAQRLVERRGYPTPAGYSRGPEDYRRMFEERQDLDAVICATPREWHAPMMVAAMEAGVWAGVEVPAAISVDECWQLVETSERTGVPLMMLENYCYFRSVLLTVNLLDLGLFGDLVHCEVGYQKDERNVRIGPNGELEGYGEQKTKHDGNLYPTHAIGPAAWSMGINRGDRFSYLVSMSSRSEHLKLFAREKFGPDHPAAKIDFKNGDVNISLIRSEQGRTVTLYFDTQSPRPWDPILRFQGSKGVFMGSLDKIFVEGLSKQEGAWEEAGPYYEKYEHPLWKRYKDLEVSGLGRGVSDFLGAQQFIEAARRKSKPPLDVYDAVTWSVITPLSEQSVAGRSAAVDFPDFTKGKWKEPRKRIYYDV